MRSIAQAQAYLDGNKRVGAQAAAVFLETNGVDTSALPETAAYDAMIAIASHGLDRAGLPRFFRQALGGDLAAST